MPLSCVGTFSLGREEESEFELEGGEMDGRGIEVAARGWRSFSLKSFADTATGNNGATTPPAVLSDGDESDVTGLSRVKAFGCGNRCLFVRVESAPGSLIGGGDT